MIGIKGQIVVRKDVKLIEKLMKLKNIKLQMIKDCVIKRCNKEM